MIRQDVVAPKEGEVDARPWSRDDRLLHRKAMAALGEGIRRYLTKAPESGGDPAL